jgi:prepilin-type N-terminal cleavage/methylation domain-containing protein
MLMRDISGQNGFTLIEMMLVIAMFGIIAAAVFYMG